MAKIINFDEYKHKKELMDATGTGEGELAFRILNEDKKREQILNLLNLNDIYHEIMEVRELGESFTKITAYDVPSIAWSKLIDIYID